MKQKLLNYKLLELSGIHDFVVNAASEGRAGAAEINS